MCCQFGAVLRSMLEGCPGESADPKGANTRVGSVMGKPLRLPTLVPIPQVLSILPPAHVKKRWAKPSFQKMTISIGGVLRF